MLRLQNNRRSGTAICVECEKPICASASTRFGAKSMAEIPKELIERLQSVDPLLRDREGAAMLGVSVPTWWRLVANGAIPKPLKIGGSSRWPHSEVLAVIERAKAQREAA